MKHDAALQIERINKAICERDSVKIDWEVTGKSWFLMNDLEWIIKIADK